MKKIFLFIFLSKLLIKIFVLIHILINKKNIKSIIIWTIFVIYLPLFIVLFYFSFGINRIILKHKLNYIKKSEFINSSDFLQMSNKHLIKNFGYQFSFLKKIGNRLSEFKITGGNFIKPLVCGKETYNEMLYAIKNAKKTIILQTYIFDNDDIGKKIVDELIKAKKRNIKIRVLIDSIGIKYSNPSILNRLNKGYIRTALFNACPSIFWRLMYINLRCHRKILVIDNYIGFTGGMNIRESFINQVNPDMDTHFYIMGPFVNQLTYTFVKDWFNVTGEKLNKLIWFSKIKLYIKNGTFIRSISTGPDYFFENTFHIIICALSIAKNHVRIQSPYFLPNETLINILSYISSKGILVDILLPKFNNVKIVECAMMSQLDKIIKSGCRIWIYQGNFDHSKIIVIDNLWSYIGSSNFDPRSFNLNFEFDSEIYDPKISLFLGLRIDELIKKSKRIKKKKHK